MSVQAVVLAAVFLARLTDHGVVWDATYRVTQEEEEETSVLRFAAPLPAGEAMEPAEGLRAVVENDRIVGLSIARAAIRSGTVSAVFVDSRGTKGKDPAELGAPVAAGDVVQILGVEPAASDRAEAAIEVTGRRFVRHVGFVAPETLDAAARDAALRAAAAVAPPVEHPIFVRGGDIEAGGLVGRIIDARARARSSAAGLGFVFAAVVGALVLAARRLRTRASTERADALLAAEIVEATRRSEV